MRPLSQSCGLEVQCPNLEQPLSQGACALSRHFHFTAPNSPPLAQMP